MQALSRKAALSLSSTVWGRPLFLMGAPECDGNAHYDGVQIGLSGESSDELLLTHSGHVRATNGDPIAIFAAWRGNTFVSLGSAAPRS